MSHTATPRTAFCHTAPPPRPSPRLLTCRRLLRHTLARRVTDRNEVPDRHAAGEAVGGLDRLALVVVQQPSINQRLGRQRQARGVQRQGRVLRGVCVCGEGGRQVCGGTHVRSCCRARCSRQHPNSVLQRHRRRCARCLSIRPSVRLPACLSVRPSARLSALSTFSSVASISSTSGGQVSLKLA